MGGPRTREELNDIVLFNSVFFGTLAWLASAAVVSDADGWWYERGQIVLALAGIVGFWVAWWLDAHDRTRQALQLGGAALADLSLWATSVHQVLF
jgi:F420-0:gamma-glutamyl ligase